MAEVIGEPGRATSVRPHARWVRISHWIATASVLTLGFLITRQAKDLPPTYGNLLRAGDTFTYAAHRALLPGHSLVSE